MKLDIKKFPDPILRAPAEDVTDFGMETQKLIDDLVETMRATGVGLAAPQVGISKKIFVGEFIEEESKNKKRKNVESFPLTVICNPEIIEYSKDETKMVEGCLSFPGLELLIKRPKETTVTGKDRYGKEIKIKAKNLQARVLQHEIDHLYSTLFIDRIMQTKIIFIGTGTLGVETLKALSNDPQYTIELVITGKTSNNKSRNKEIKNPILETAEALKLPVLETENINDEKVVAKIEELKPELGIMADFGQIIGDRIISIPEHGIINIHPSLLPEYRGPSPVKQAILDGKKESGITLIKTVKKMDAGDIVAQGTVELSGSETGTILKNYFGELAANFVLNTLPYYLSGDLKPYTQEENKTTYTRLFDKSDGFVNAKTPAKEVERKVRAFDDWPKVTYKLKNGKTVQISAVHFDPEKKLIIDRVKPEGKREMTYEEFVRGYQEELTFS